MLERRGWNFYLSGNREEARSQFDRALAAYANARPAEGGAAGPRKNGHGRVSSAGRGA